MQDYKMLFPQKHWLPGLIALLLITASCANKPGAYPAAPNPTVNKPWWVPAQGASYQIQLDGYPPDLDVQADIFELDLFEAPPEAFQALHAHGQKVVCYINAGAWEEFRPDADAFPAEVIGNDYTGWAGEKWLDISHYAVFSALIEKRLDLAAIKGCDAVEMDNIDGYQQTTGFAITSRDQLEYNIWLSFQAHKRGLGIGLKNDPDQVPQLLQYFDFAVVEDCTVYDECELYLPFVAQGKVVIQIEYTDNFSSTADFCPQASSSGTCGLLKHRNLDGWVKFCD